MKVGDLVKYKEWWASEYTMKAVGIILETPASTHKDFAEQNYGVYWLRGNWVVGEHHCMGKFLEVVK